MWAASHLDTRRPSNSYVIINRSKLRVQRIAVPGPTISFDLMAAYPEAREPAFVIRDGYGAMGVRLGVSALPTPVVWLRIRHRAPLQEGVIRLHRLTSGKEKEGGSHIEHRLVPEEACEAGGSGKGAGNGIAGRTEVQHGRAFTPGGYTRGWRMPDYSVMGLGQDNDLLRSLIGGRGKFTPVNTKPYTEMAGCFNRIPDVRVSSMESSIVGEEGGSFPTLFGNGSLKPWENCRLGRSSPTSGTRTSVSAFWVDDTMLKGGEL